MSKESLVVLDAASVEAVFTKRQFVADRPILRDILRALSDGNVVNRDIAERQSSLKQAVAYATLRSGDDLLCLKRTVKMGGELKGRWTVVFGGHVNADERDGLNGLRRCLIRELCEEFGQLNASEPEFKGIVADPTSEIGKRHLGFMFEVRVHASTIRLDRRYDNAEYSLIPGKRYFSDIDQLVGDDYHRFDPWSQLVLGVYRSHPS